MTTAFAEDNHEHDQMLSIQEAAAFLRVPVATMRYWRYTGDGPFSFKVARHVRYWRTDLVLWRADKDADPKTHRGRTHERVHSRGNRAGGIVGFGVRMEAWAARERRLGCHRA